MQLSLSFSFLLTTLLFALTQVEAHPTERAPGLVTLPLRRVVREADDHPSTVSSASHESPSGGGGGGGGGKNGGTKADPKDGFPGSALSAQRANDITKSYEPTANNSLGIDIQGNDLAYTTIIQIGTPPRNFTVMLDAGSADFWVGAEDCRSEDGGSCGDHVVLGGKSSSTFKDTGKNWDILIGQAKVSGTVVTDDIKIAGLAVKTHTFGVAHIKSKVYANNYYKYDGFLGTAKSTIARQGAPSLIEALAHRGLISKPIVSYKFPRLTDGLYDGQVTFGGLDSSKFDKDTLVTFKNINRGFWEGHTNIAIGGKDIGLQNRTAVFTTIHTYIYAPKDDVNAFHAKIPGSKTNDKGDHIIPCTNTAVVSLTFGGRAFDINPIDLLDAPVDPNLPKGDCYSNILPFSGGRDKQWFVGYAFLKNVYFSHDVDRDEISLANLV